MTATRLHRAMSVLRWGALDVAAETGVNERTVRRWLRDDYEPPARLLAWLETLAAFHGEHPAP